MLFPSWKGCALIAEFFRLSLIEFGVGLIE
jgi:hypothetical protein